MRQLILPVIALGMLSFAVLHVVKANQEPPRAKPPIEPARNPFTQTLAGTGIIEARSENIAIGSQLPGVVMEVFVKVGQRLKKGDPFFRLDDRQLKSELAFRQAFLNASRASLAKTQQLPRPEEVPPLEAKLREAQASLNAERDQFARANTLIKTRAIGDEELIRRQNATAIAEAKVAEMEADLKLLKAGAWEYDLAINQAAVAQAQAQLQQVQTEIDRLTVKAQIDGEVLQLNVHPGEYVGIPPSQTLIVYGDTSVKHVRVDIDENDIPRFKPGLDGLAFARGNSTEQIPLKYVRVEPYVIPKKSLSGGSTERVDTRVLQVIYAIEKATADLYVGQQLDVLLNTETAGEIKATR